MAKIGSRRTGGAGIDVSNVTGVLRFVAGQDPQLLDLATQEQAEAGLDNGSVMTPLRVKQAIDVLASVANVGSAAMKASARVRKLAGSARDGAVGSAVIVVIQVPRWRGCRWSDSGS
jgi:uncharacterized protein YwlG (UPF0340 family)